MVLVARQIDLAASAIRELSVAQPHSVTNLLPAHAREAQLTVRSSTLSYATEISTLLSLITNSASQSRENESRTECVIDLEEIRFGQMALRLPCMHVFHKSCILPFLLSEELPRCPIDRTPISKDDVEHLPVWKWGS
eukprot:IDg15279t1